MAINRIIKLGLEEEANKLKSQGLSDYKIAEELSRIAGQKITQSTVWRYFNQNKDAVVKRVKQREEIVGKAINHRLNVVEQLKEINDAARSILMQALQAADFSTAIKAMREVREQLELQAKLLGDIAAGPQIIIVKWEQ